MIPGEVVFGDGDIEINPGAPRMELEIVNTGDRPVQVGSHVHVPQANRALRFDRAAAHGQRFDIPAGTAIRFEPGVAQRVRLVPLTGAREVHGLSLDPPGRLDEKPMSARAKREPR
ncbi:urease subunit beta [Mycobacterium sp. SMC-8]|uniref:urease subunit beta n=1 Tax=Mycobacterium sp. SMC-8 TaxID=2857060 RepID=UPI0021B2F9E8|nr:urease subunit beta [Mycobacterium sp. SMC-8]UXA10910.1 urease subunit beta [Mycobacterium sp. SMC-8]